MKSIYKWSRKDRVLYFAVLLPFAVAFIGTAYLLATVAPYLAAIFILLYVAVNVFQAGCCVGCPYRGRYCPPVFGLYLANFLSSQIYKNRSFRRNFFKVNANLAELFLGLTLSFPIYWFLSLNWLYLLGFVFLILMHAALFFPSQCTRCSYNDTCPGGQTTLKLLKR